jgi:hypothetical protein
MVSDSDSVGRFVRTSSDVPQPGIAAGDIGVTTTTAVSRKGDEDDSDDSEGALK